MPVTHLSAGALRRALGIRDLTDPTQGLHAMQRLLAEIERSLERRWRVRVRRVRAHPLVSLEENYDRLLVPADAVARDARYTRYVNDTAVLRTHTSATIPPSLRDLSRAPDAEVVLSCPGLVYRRDVVDTAVTSASLTNSTSGASAPRASS